MDSSSKLVSIRIKLGISLSKGIFVHLNKGYADRVHVAKLIAYGNN